MRGTDERAGSLFSYVDLERRIPSKHPLRVIRAIVNEALSTLDADFAGLYARIGRPSIPPEQLLRAMLLQLIYAIRSERLLVERLDFDLSFQGGSGSGYYSFADMLDRGGVGAGGFSGAMSVPEPATVLLLGLSSLAITRRRCG